MIIICAKNSQSLAPLSWKSITFKYNAFGLILNSTNEILYDTNGFTTSQLKNLWF